MAPNNKTAVDFDKIIQADRQRRKNEALAEQIFGGGRRASAPNAGAIVRKPGTGPSLASRVGVTKARSVSTTFKPAVGKFGKQVATPKTTPSSGNVNAEWTHDLHGVNNPASQRGVQQRFGRNGRGVRGDRLNKALNGGTFASGVSNQFNVVGNSKPNSGMSIRGLAGPCCIRAQNFAPGTTAADIESAMTPIGGKVLKCSIVTNVPTVVAEIVFESKEGADMVIETFNNQTADGRILRLYIKPGPVNLSASLTTGSEPSTSPAIPLGPRADRYRESDSYQTQARSRDRSHSYAREEVIDGTYGFDDRMDTDQDDGKRLYSDTAMGSRSNGGYRDAGRERQDSRERARGGERNRGYR